MPAPGELQSVHASIAATGPVQCEIRSSQAPWPGFQGGIPYSAWSRCHLCSAQNEPSRAVHAAIRYGSCGPWYGLQVSRSVFQTSWWKLPHPPE